MLSTQIKSWEPEKDIEKSAWKNTRLEILIVLSLIHDCIDITIFGFLASQSLQLNETLIRFLSRQFRKVKLCYFLLNFFFVFHLT